MFSNEHLFAGKNFLSSFQDAVECIEATKQFKEYVVQQKFKLNTVNDLIQSKQIEIKNGIVQKGPNFDKEESRTKELELFAFSKQINQHYFPNILKSKSYNELMKNLKMGSEQLEKDIQKQQE